MPAPVINITAGASIVPRSSPTDTGPAHIIGISATGPAGRLLTLDDDVNSHGEWLEIFGGGSLANGRLSYSIDSDWVEKFFLRGGHTLRYSRVLGPAAAKAVLNLAGSSGTSLVATADEYGSFYNQFKLQVTNGTDGTTRIVKLLASDGTTVLDQTVQQASQAAFSGLKLATGTGMITLSIGGGTGLPSVVAATSMGGTTSGTDDHASITQTQLDAALALLTIDLGPGQAAAPNWQTDAMHDSLDAHAAAFNRFAVPDPIDTTVKATFVSAGQHHQANVNGDRGALFAPWVQMSPFAEAGSNRSVPPSAVFCAACATTDVDPEGGVAQSPAGIFGIDTTARGVNATFSRMPVGASDADDLSKAGVNLIIEKNGQVMIYDNLTGAAQDSEFAQIGVARWRMATVALAGSEADGEIFRTVTRQHLADWQSAVNAILLRQYDQGQLFGDLDDDRPETAFNVNVGPNVNTPTTINAGQMNMLIAARPVKGGRILNISITAVPITQPVV